MLCVRYKEKLQQFKRNLKILRYCYREKKYREILIYIYMYDNTDTLIKSDRGIVIDDLGVKLIHIEPMAASRFVFFESWWIINKISITSTCLLINYKILSRNKRVFAIVTLDWLRINCLQMQNVTLIRIRNVYMARDTCMWRSDTCRRIALLISTRNALCRISLDVWIRAVNWLDDEHPLIWIQRDDLIVI